jgi:hypothetical protein
MEISNLYKESFKELRKNYKKYIDTYILSCIEFEKDTSDIKSNIRINIKSIFSIFSKIFYNTNLTIYNETEIQLLVESFHSKLAVIYDSLYLVKYVNELNDKNNPSYYFGILLNILIDYIYTSNEICLIEEYYEILANSQKFINNFNKYVK